MRCEERRNKEICPQINQMSFSLKCHEEGRLFLMTVAADHRQISYQEALQALLPAIETTNGLCVCTHIMCVYIYIYIYRYIYTHTHTYLQSYIYQYYQQQSNSVFSLLTNTCTSRATNYFTVSYSESQNAFKSFIHIIIHLNF